MFRVLDAYGRSREHVDFGAGPKGLPGIDAPAGAEGPLGPFGRPGMAGHNFARGLAAKARLDQDVIGNLPVSRFNGGLNADGFSVWRGDGTWADIGEGNGSSAPEVYIAPDNGGGGGVNNVPNTAPTNTSVVTDADGQYERISSNADGSVQQRRSSQVLTTVDANPIYWARIRTGSSLANIRIWIGLTTAAFTNVDTHAGDCVALRYSTVAGDGGWVGVTNGASQSVTSTIAAINASTKYTIKIALSAGGTVATFTVNGVSVSTSSTLPASGTTFMMSAAVIRVSTANKTLDVKYQKLWR